MLLRYFHKTGIKTDKCHKETPQAKDNLHPVIKLKLITLFASWWVCYTF